jgi:hypothetical protein
MTFLGLQPMAWHLGRKTNPTGDQIQIARANTRELDTPHEFQGLGFPFPFD